MASMWEGTTGQGVSIYGLGMHCVLDVAKAPAIVAVIAAWSCARLPGITYHPDSANGLLVCRPAGPDHLPVAA